MQHGLASAATQTAEGVWEWKVSARGQGYAVVRGIVRALVAEHETTAPGSEPQELGEAAAAGDMQAPPSHSEGADSGGRCSRSGGSSNDSDKFDGYAAAGEEEEEEDDDDDDDDALAARPVASSQLVELEAHIVYSSTYNVPVLYFHAQHLDGRPLDARQVWQLVSPHYRHDLAAHNATSDLPLISHDEHPILMRPFYFLHPCHTREFMQPVVADVGKCPADQAPEHSFNYVASWFSVAGQILRLATA